MKPLMKINGLVTRKAIRQMVNAFLGERSYLVDGVTYWVYVLRKRNGLYVGVTQFPYQRLDDHFKVKDEDKVAEELLYMEEFKDLKEAVEREKALHSYFKVKYRNNSDVLRLKHGRGKGPSKCIIRRMECKE